MNFCFLLSVVVPQNFYNYLKFILRQLLLSIRARLICNIYFQHLWCSKLFVGYTIRNCFSAFLFCALAMQAQFKIQNKIIQILNKKNILLINFLLKISCKNISFISIYTKNSPIYASPPICMPGLYAYTTIPSIFYK